MESTKGIVSQASEHLAVQIRAARPSESEKIVRVHECTAKVAYAHIFPGHTFPRKETIDRWRSFRGQILVAEQGDRILGFVAFDEIELHALYVLPEYQGQGIGRQLLRAAGAVTRLWVLEENFSARQFYEAHGWRSDGDERLAYGIVEVLYCRPGTAQ